MSAAIPIPPFSVESLEDELSCEHCGYSLRGLDRAGNCPECGTSIQQSITENQKQTKTFRTIRLGAGCLLFAIATQFAPLILPQILTDRASLAGWMADVLLRVLTVGYATASIALLAAYPRVPVIDRPFRFVLYGLLLTYCGISLWMIGSYYFLRDDGLTLYPWTFHISCIVSAVAYGQLARATRRFGHPRVAVGFALLAIGHLVLLSTAFWFWGRNSISAVDSASLPGVGYVEDARRDYQYLLQTGDFISRFRTIFGLVQALIDLLPIAALLGMIYLLRMRQSPRDVK